MSAETDWSADWKGSSNPQKQRKYRENAPLHKSDQFVTSRLDDSLQENVGTTTLPVRSGDRVKVMRGDHSGERGEVREVDREEYKLYIEGVERETVSGSEVTVAIDPSNVTLTKLNLDDDQRLAKYGVSEAEKEEIRAVTAEEAGEEEETDEAEEETEESEDTAVYDDIVDENIDEVKEYVRNNDVDLEQLLNAEQDNKDRKTLVEWLENRMEDDSNE